MMTPALALLLCSLFLIWLAFLAWTIRCLWFRRDRTLDSRVYTYGVQRYGPLTWAGTVVILFYLDMREFAAVALIMLPVFLWMGFFWGRTMTALRPGSK